MRSLGLLAAGVLAAFLSCSNPVADSGGGGSDTSSSPPAAVAVSNVSLNKVVTDLVASGTEQLFATVFPSNATNKNLAWSSSNTSAAIVSSTGMVTATGVGTTTITVTSVDGAKTTQCVVHVLGSAHAITNLTSVKSSATILINETENLSVSFSPTDTTNQNLTWSSDNTAVATVSSQGQVKGIGVGSATITATSVMNGSKTATVSVNVVNSAILASTITMNKTSSNLATGDSDTLSVSFDPVGSTNQSIMWSSSNSNVISVSNSGSVIATGPGSATVTATTSNGKTAICNFVVTQPVTGVSLNKSSTTILTGATESLAATVSPANATNKAVTWSTSNASIATVDSAGLVTAVAAGGPVNITVTTSDGSFTAICAVTVTNAPVAVSSVSLNKSSTGILTGNTEQLTETISPVGATNQNVTWTSSNTSVASVSSSGLVTALSNGSSTITVKTQDGNKTATCLVTVNTAVSSVSLNKTSTTINIAATETLTTTVLPASASNKSVTWSSSNTGVATVSSSGLVTGVAKGSATITATTVDGSFVATCTVTVTKPVSSVSLDKSTSLMPIGNTVQLTETVLPADASNLSVNWTTGNSAVATVSSSGLVTATGVGSTTITATSVDGSKTASFTLNSYGLIITEATNSVFSNYSVAVEIYNPTNQTIDISTYKLRSNANVVGSYSLSSYTSFPLPSVNIGPGEYLIIRGNPEGANLIMEGGTKVIYLYSGSLYPSAAPSWGLFELTKAGVTSDFMRWGTLESASPTTAGTWTGAVGAVSDFPTGSSYLGYSKARNASNTNTRSASDWTERSWSTLGGPNDVSTDSASDIDGIPDSAKVSSGTFAGLPLNSWGASSGQKDVFVHIDYMVNGTVSATDPGIIPQKAALDKVVAAFLVKGIHIHFDVGDLYGTGAANYNLDGTSHAVPYSANISKGKTSGYSNVYKYKNTYMAAAKNRVFYYMLFANSQNFDGSAGSSGIADIGGNTSIISLGGWSLNKSTTADTNTLVNYQAGTIMHEFGHNLGLHHGGNTDNNYKPNYFSIMNYLYQLNGLPTVGSDEASRYYYGLFTNPTSTYSVSSYPSFASIADPSGWTDGPDSNSFNINYSDGTGGSISESSINENLGIRRTGSSSIDFDMSGGLSSALSFKILYKLGDPLTTSSTAAQTLSDFNDWTKISSVFQRTGMGYNSGVGPKAGPSSKTTNILSSPTESLDVRAIFDNLRPLSSGTCAPDPRKNFKKK